MITSNVIVRGFDSTFFDCFLLMSILLLFDAGMIAKRLLSCNWVC